MRDLIHSNVEDYSDRHLDELFADEPGTTGITFSSAL